MEIRIIEKAERDTAIALIDAVFVQFEAPDYSSEGVKTFRNTTIYNDNFLSTLVMHGAYDKETLVGVIATRNKGNHIALFFVDGNHHRQGIGRKLFEKVLENSTTSELTVNASPYAVEVYHRFGFRNMTAEQTTDGMRYTPMTYIR